MACNRILTTVIAIVALSICTLGKTKKNIAKAPLPSVIVNAKTVFLVNAAGGNVAFDTLYAELKDWGKYQIVGSPETADLIIELTFQVEHDGTDVSSFTNSYTGKTQVVSTQIIDPQLKVTIYDAKSKNSLWMIVDHRKLATREKNRRKETIKSVDRIVNQLKVRSALASDAN